MRTFADVGVKAVSQGAIELTKSLGRSAGSSIGRNATRSNGMNDNNPGEREKHSLVHFAFTSGGGALGILGYTMYVFFQRRKEKAEFQRQLENDVSLKEQFEGKEFTSKHKYLQGKTIVSAIQKMNDRLDYIQAGYVDYEWKLSGAATAAGVGVAVGEVAYRGWRLSVDYIRAKKENIEQQLSDASSGIKVISANEVMALQQPTFNLRGKFGDFLGENLDLSFVVLVYGIPGAGKSHLATQMASVFAQSGAVLYVLSEEGYSESVRERIEHYRPAGDLFTTQSRDWKNIYQYIVDNPQIRFVVIDSLNGLTGNYDEQINIVRALRSIPHLYGSVVISQINKDQTAKAGTGLLHEVDAEVFVHDGIAETRKNRFASGGRSMAIFPEKQGVLRLSGTDGFSK